MLRPLWSAAAIFAALLAAGPERARAEMPDNSLNGPRRPAKTKRERRRKVSTPPYYAAIGEGQTLPQNVVRLRLPYNHVTARSGFDKDGKRQDLGLKLNAVASAFVLEYGATSRLTVQLLAPYILSNELGLDANRFRQSAIYREKAAAFAGGVAKKLQAQGICPSPAACSQLIESGYALPVDTAVTLPTGEALTVKAGVPVKIYADALVVGAARPLAGRTGLGDVELGGLFSFVRTYNFGIAAGAGLRLPTGSFADVPSGQRGTGRGTVDLGLRFNADASPTPGLWFSYQNQAELVLRKGKKRRTSLLDDSQLNAADAASDASVAAGADGKPNEQAYERRGVRNVGFVKVGWGLGNVAPALSLVGLQAQFKYAVQAEEFLDGVSQGPRQTSTAALGGVTLDGLAYQVPAQLAFDHEVPVSGANQTLATTVDLVTLKAFYKF